MSQGTAGGEMYDTLEGWDYSDDYTHNSEDGGAMSVLQEDVETVLGLQVVVKSMLDDVIGGQHTQTEQLSSILGSSVLTSNRSTEPSQTTLSTTAAQRDIDMEYWRVWWRSCRETVHRAPPLHLQTTHSPRARLHRPHRLIHLDTD